MSKKNLIGVLYVSILIVIWGSIGSFIDFPLLKSNVYEQSSLGQASTFIFTGIVSIISGIKIFKSLKLGDIK